MHSKAAEGDSIHQSDGINNHELLEEHNDHAVYIGNGIHKPHDPFKGAFVNPNYIS